jgi:predicted transposase/invertase (TIGR01784 family)
MLATNMQKWYQTAQTQGIELGMQKGKLEGKLEGKHERELEIARNMLANGLDADLITKLTGLTLEEIRTLH